MFKYNDQHHICKTYPKDLDFDLGHADIYRVKIKSAMVLLIENKKEGEPRFINIDVSVLHKASDTFLKLTRLF